MRPFRGVLIWNAVLVVPPLLLFLLVRHVYMSSPPMVLRQYRAAMRDGDLVALKNCASTEMFAIERQRMAGRQEYARKHGLRYSQYAARLDQPLEAGIREYGIRWTSVDSTHGRAEILTEVVSGSRPGFFVASLGPRGVYNFVKTDRGWVCDDVDIVGLM